MGSHATTPTVVIRTVGVAEWAVTDKTGASGIFHVTRSASIIVHTGPTKGGRAGEGGMTDTLQQGGRTL